MIFLEFEEISMCLLVLDREFAISAAAEKNFCEGDFS
jgi:hypothetical protein